MPSLGCHPSCRDKSMQAPPRQGTGQNRHLTGSPEQSGRSRGWKHGQTVTALACCGPAEGTPGHSRSISAPVSSQEQVHQRHIRSRSICSEEAYILAHSFTQGGFHFGLSQTKIWLAGVPGQQHFSKDQPPVPPPEPRPILPPSPETGREAVGAPGS